jgi:hypothetical protein
MDLQIDLLPLLSVPSLAAQFNTEAAIQGMEVRVCFVAANGLIDIPSVSTEACSDPNPLLDDGYSSDLAKDFNSVPLDPRSICREEDVDFRDKR